MNAQPLLLSEILRSSKEVTLDHWASRNAPSHDLEYFAQVGRQPYPVAPKKEYQDRFGALRAAWGEARGYDASVDGVPVSLTLISSSLPSSGRPNIAAIHLGSEMKSGETKNTPTSKSLDQTPKALHSVATIIAGTCFAEDKSFLGSLEREMRKAYLLAHETGSGLRRQTVSGKNVTAVIDAADGRYLNVLFLWNGWNNAPGATKVACDFNEPLTSSQH